MFPGFNQNILEKFCTLLKNKIYLKYIEFYVPTYIEEDYIYDLF